MSNVKIVSLTAMLALALVTFAGPVAHAETMRGSADFTAELQTRLTTIETEISVLQDKMIATNLADDPSARAAAVADAEASIRRLIQECREAEALYAQLLQILPRRVSAADRGQVTADLAYIRAGLADADRDLNGVDSLVASVR